jgi:lysophospholipid acyltransferase (LPLAT)-like uncharacterized protein
VPRPFSTVAVAIGAPIEVPLDADADTIEKKRLELEHALYTLEERAQHLLSPEA